MVLELRGSSRFIVSHFGLFVTTYPTISSTKAPHVLLTPSEQRGEPPSRAGEARQHSGGRMRALEATLGTCPQRSQRLKTLAREQRGLSFSGAPSVGGHRAHGDAA